MSAMKRLEELVGEMENSPSTRTLRDIKLCMIQLPHMNGQETSTAAQERRLCRSGLELACTFAVQGDDIQAFERDYAQLRPYYTQSDQLLEPSKRRFTIVGLRLMQLLVESRLADFHTELELVPDEGRADPCVAFATRIEEGMMEGNYSKVLRARTDVPSPLFAVFMDSIVDTVRDEMGRCCEAAYATLDAGAAQSMLRFDSAGELQAFAQKRDGWASEGGNLRFGGGVEKKVDKDDLPSLALVRQALMYATELERIV
jgi:26S proteasome regulatory subunit N12